MLGILGLEIAPTAAGEAVERSVHELARALRAEAAQIFSSEPPPTLDEVVAFILNGREQARRSKDFKMADAIRSRLMEAGILVEDLPTGPRWRIATPAGHPD
jgi:cysteinyl-tRNA synthetase